MRNSENWDSLKPDERSFLEFGAVVTAAAISAGAVMSIVKASTGWEANWAFVLMPAYIPIFLTVTVKLCYKTMRNWVD